MRCTGCPSPVPGKATGQCENLCLKSPEEVKANYQAEVNSLIANLSATADAEDRMVPPPIPGSRLRDRFVWRSTLPITGGGEAAFTPTGVQWANNMTFNAFISAGFTALDIFKFGLGDTPEIQQQLFYDGIHLHSWANFAVARELLSFVFERANDMTDPSPQPRMSPSPVADTPTATASPAAATPIATSSPATSPTRTQAAATSSAPTTSTLSSSPSGLLHPPAASRHNTSLSVGVSGLLSPAEIAAHPLSAHFETWGSALSQQGATLLLAAVSACLLVVALSRRKGYVEG